MKKWLLSFCLVWIAGQLFAQQPGKEMLSFALLKANNPALSSDFSVKNGVESYNVITLPIGTNVSALKPTFTLSAGAKATINGSTQTSSTSPVDFSKPVIYRITGSDGSTRDYTIEASMQVDIATLDDAVKSFMTKYDVPGLSIALLKNERLVYAKGYGVADKSSSTPVTTNSLFRIASVSKSITARAALKLVDEGKLSLDQKVFGTNGILGTTLGSKPYSAQLEQITVRNLLNHTAGGDVWTNVWDPANNKLDPFYQQEWLGYTGEQVISATLDTRPLTQTPGSKFVYSNIGINIAGRVIEKVSGVKYDKYVQDNLLTPIGIDPATMKLGGSTLAERFPNEVVYYNPYPGYDQPYDFPVPRLDAHGGWITTATNMARLLAFTDGAPAKKDILSAASIQEMYTPSAASLSASPSYGYGLGCYINTASKASTHDGGMAGTSATWWRFPSGYTYVVLANTRKSDASYYGDLELFLNNALFSGTPLAYTQLMKGDQFDTYYGQPVSSQSTYCLPIQREIYSCASSDGTIGIESFKVWSAGKAAMLLDSKGVCSQSGNAYSDLTGQAAIKLRTGSSYPFSVEAMRIQSGASKGNIYINPVSIWVDLDQNKVFTDDERIITQLYPNTLIESQFTIPATAKTGQTRLRIRLGTAFTGLPETPCEQIDGETEDYLVDISGSCQLSTTLTASSITICQGTSTTLTAATTGGQGTVTYAWQRDNTPLTETGAVLSANTGGVYRITATDGSSCSANSTATVVVASLPLAVITGKTSFCIGQVTSLSATASAGTAPYTYLWRQGSNVPVTTASYTVSAAGSYSVTIKDKNGCDSQPASVSVIEDQLPAVNLAGNTWFCTGKATSVSAVVTGGISPYSLQWQRDGNVLTSDNALYVSAAGAFTVTAKDNRGCIGSNSFSVVESRNPVPVVTGSTSICVGQTISLTASSAEGTAPFISNWQRDQTAIGTGSPFLTVVAGTYVATMTDAKGCVGTSAGFVFTPKAVPAVQIVGVNMLTGGVVSLSASPSEAVLSHQWSLNGSALSGATSATYTVRQSGTYRVTISSDGCNSVSPTLTVTILANGGRRGAVELTPVTALLTVAPNPSAGQVTIRFQLQEPAPATLILTDLLGRPLREWRLPNSQTHHELQADLRPLPAGLYLLVAEAAGQRVASKLLIE